MEKKFSRDWNSSVQARKQRKYRYNAPLHLRQKMVSVHLDKVLRKEYNKRAIPVRKGDEVVVMNGDNKGKRGKVTQVNLKKLRVYVDGLKTRKGSGQEVDVGFDPSNLKIVMLNLDDKMRKKAFLRKKKDVKKNGS